MSAELTFASVGPGGVVHYARCEPCMHGQCPGGWHSWAGAEDVEHALKTGLADPSGKVCACHCVTDGETDEMPDDIEVVSLNADPCETCGELGACAYDAEGRPLIHTTELVTYSSIQDDRDRPGCLRVQVSGPPGAVADQLRAHAARLAPSPGAETQEGATGLQVEIAAGREPRGLHGCPDPACWYAPHTGDHAYAAPPRSTGPLP